MDANPFGVQRPGGFRGQGGGEAIGSGAVGPVSLDGRPHGPTPFEPAAPREFGEDVAGRIDAEVRMMVEEARDRASAMLADRREAIDRAAARLLERETLDGDELRALLVPEGPASGPKEPAA